MGDANDEVNNNPSSVPNSFSSAGRNDSNSPVTAVKFSRRPLTKGRVHNYESEQRQHASDEDASDKMLIQDLNSNHVDSCFQVQCTLQPTPCVSVRARLFSPPLASFQIKDISMERARLVSCIIPNNLFILPEPEPLDCCSPSVTPVLSAYSPVPLLPPYTIDKDQLFPGSVFDSHCHLDFIYRRLKGKEEDSGPVRSLQACLVLDKEELGSIFGGCVANFCNPTDWGQGRSGRLVSSVIKESAKDIRVHLTIGCHPHYADRMQGNRMDQLAMLVSGLSTYIDAKVMAVGECGLDYSKKNAVGKEVQKQVFAGQLKIALKFKLPLVLHIRDAEADGYSVLKAAGVPPTWPIHRHCFTGDWSTAATWLDQYPGSKIGVTGLVTYKEAVRVHEVVRNIPLNRLLLETDAPYFLPTGIDRSLYPWTCALPGHVLHVAAQVAALKGVQLRDVLEQNLRNVKEIYRVGCGGEREGKVEIVRAMLKR